MSTLHTNGPHNAVSPNSKRNPTQIATSKSDDLFELRFLLASAHRFKSSARRQLVPNASDAATIESPAQTLARLQCEVVRETGDVGVSGHPNGQPNGHLDGGEQAAAAPSAQNARMSLCAAFERLAPRDRVSLRGPPLSCKSTALHALLQSYCAHVLQKNDADQQSPPPPQSQPEQQAEQQADQQQQQQQQQQKQSPQGSGQMVETAGLSALWKRFQLVFFVEHATLRNLRRQLINAPASTAIYTIPHTSSLFSALLGLLLTETIRAANEALLQEQLRAAAGDATSAAPATQMPVLSAEAIDVFVLDTLTHLHLWTANLSRVLFLVDDLSVGALDEIDVVHQLLAEMGDAAAVVSARDSTYFTPASLTQLPTTLRLLPLLPAQLSESVATALPDPNARQTLEQLLECLEWPRFPPSARLALAALSTNLDAELPKQPLRSFASAFALIFLKASNFSEAAVSALSALAWNVSIQSGNELVGRFVDSREAVEQLAKLSGLSHLELRECIEQFSHLGVLESSAFHRGPASLPAELAASAPARSGAGRQPPHSLSHSATSASAQREAAPAPLRQYRFSSSFVQDVFAARCAYRLLVELRERGELQSALAGPLDHLLSSRFSSESLCILLELLLAADASAAEATSSPSAVDAFFTWLRPRLNAAGLQVESLSQRISGLLRVQLVRAAKLVVTRLTGVSDAFKRNLSLHIRELFLEPNESSTQENLLIDLSSVEALSDDFFGIIDELFRDVASSSASATPTSTSTSTSTSIPSARTAANGKQIALIVPLGALPSAADVHSVTRLLQQYGSSICSLELSCEYLVRQLAKRALDARAIDLWFEALGQLLDAVLALCSTDESAAAQAQAQAAAMRSVETSTAGTGGELTLRLRRLALTLDCELVELLKRAPHCFTPHDYALAKRFEAVLIERLSSAFALTRPAPPSPPHSSTEELEPHREPKPPDTLLQPLPLPQTDTSTSSSTPATQPAAHSNAEQNVESEVQQKPEESETGPPQATDDNTGQRAESTSPSAPQQPPPAAAEAATSAAQSSETPSAPQPQATPTPSQPQPAAQLQPQPAVPVQEAQAPAPELPRRVAKLAEFEFGLVHVYHSARYGHAAGRQHRVQPHSTTVYLSDFFDPANLPGAGSAADRRVQQLLVGEGAAGLCYGLPSLEPLLLLEMLAEFLKTAHVETLTLSGCFLHRDVLNVLRGGLLACRPLETLRIAGAVSSHRGAKSASSALSCIEMGGITALADILKAHRGIRSISLDLEGYCAPVPASSALDSKLLGGHGAVGGLADRSRAAVRTTSSLDLEILLSILFRSLPATPALRVLEISCPRFPLSVLESFAELLERCDALESCTIATQNFEDLLLVYLSSGVVCATSLKSLVFRGSFSSLGGAELLNFLQAALMSPALETVTLECAPIAHRALDWLLLCAPDLLESACALRKLQVNIVGSVELADVARVAQYNERVAQLSRLVRAVPPLSVEASNELDADELSLLSPESLSPLAGSGAVLSGGGGLHGSESGTSSPTKKALSSSSCGGGGGGGVSGGELRNSTSNVSESTESCAQAVCEPLQGGSGAGVQQQPAPTGAIAGVGSEGTPMPPSTAAPGESHPQHNHIEEDEGIGDATSHSGSLPATGAAEAGLVWSAHLVPMGAQKNGSWD